MPNKGPTRFTSDQPRRDGSNELPPFDEEDAAK